MDEVCEVEGCDNPINRDGLCFKDKIKTVQMSAAQVTRERKGKGWGIDPYAGTRENVRAMYEQRRKDGLPDPEPDNREAARYAPAQGPIRPKLQEKYR